MEYSIWIIDGRDASAYRKNGQSKVKSRPWRAGAFNTLAEAEAFRLGVQAAIGGGLRNVVFLPEDEAKEIDKRVVEQLRKEYPHIKIECQ